MGDIYCYSFVEDRPSAEVVKKLAAHRNACCENALLFLDGFPNIKRGKSDIRRMAPALVQMARGGIWT